MKAMLQSSEEALLENVAKEQGGEHGMRGGLCPVENI